VWLLSAGLCEQLYFNSFHLEAASWSWGVEQERMQPSSLNAGSTCS
jgi:hypothetical protein